MTKAKILQQKLDACRAKQTAVLSQERAEYAKIRTKYDAKMRALWKLDKDLILRLDKIEQAAAANELKEKDA